MTVKLRYRCKAIEATPLKISPVRFERINEETLRELANKVETDPAKFKNYVK
jgi:hypothetical protein